VIVIDLTPNLTAQERQAWQVIRPKLKTYLTKIWRVYRRANDAQRQLLLEHNPILAALVEMTGDE
jgi:hypothetical protein